MRTETSEAFSRLVTTFVIAIEDAGGTLPADMEQRLTSSPLKACELLNELALTCGGIDPDTDSVLAAIYESMDAADARTPLDEAGAARIIRALNRAHKEPAAPKPEPTPAPAHAEPEVWESTTKDGEGTGQGAEGTGSKPVEETERKPGRRSRAARARQERPEHDGQDAGTEVAVAAAADEASPQPERKARRSRHAAEKDATLAASEGEAGGPSHEPAPSGSGDGKEAPAEVTATEPETGAKAAEVPTGPARSAEEAGITGDVLTVDQAIAALGLSRPTIYKFIENGKLPAFKKGRSWQISADAVAALADK